MHVYCFPGTISSDLIKHNSLNVVINFILILQFNRDYTMSNNLSSKA